jgi:hypothetical protein
MAGEFCNAVEGRQTVTSVNYTNGELIQDEISVVFVRHRLTIKIIGLTLNQLLDNIKM